MIRPFTCVMFLLACGSGLYLYQSKHRVKLLDEQIAQTVRSTDALREQTRMLGAEWTLLNDPERLRQLATQFLTLQTVSPNQFTSVADLDGRLPQPAPPGPPPDDGGPSDQAAVPVASNNSGRAGEDAGKSADAKIADVSPGSPKNATPSAPASSPGAGSASVRTAMTTSPDPAHAAERKPVVPRIVPAPLHLASSQPRPPDQRGPDTRFGDQRPSDQRSADQRVVDQRGLEQRNPVQHVAETRVMAVAPRAPAPTVVPPAAGSLLGMAHGAGAPPVPLPLPRPMPVSAPQWSFTNGG